MNHHAADINSRPCPRTPALVHSPLVPLLFREHNISQAAPWTEEIMIQIRFPAEMRFPDCHFLYLLCIVVTRSQQQIQGKHSCDKHRNQNSSGAFACASVHLVHLFTKMPYLCSSVAPMLARLRRVHPRFSVREVALGHLRVHLSCWIHLNRKRGSS